MTWQEFTALLVLATAMSFSPGPNTTLSTALAANGGMSRAMRFVLAVPVGWTLLLTLCAAGLGALVVAAPVVRLLIKALGIAYLLWLALKLVAGWIAGQADALHRFAIVAPVMLFYAFASNFTYALIGALLRNWLAQGRRRLWFNRAMAALLVLTAAWMVKA